ncbi:MAG: hypothetical protein FJ290_24525 [Planctomycetes bacterium]|nr:hypothetical protein [Planctomycetota bacterium]
MDPGIRLPQPPPLCGFFQEELKRTVWSGWRAKGGRTVALPGRDPAFIVQWEATIENEFEVIGKCGLPLGHAGDHKPPKRLEYRGQKTVTEEESYPAGTKRPQPPPPLPLPLKGQ